MTEEALSCRTKFRYSHRGELLFDHFFTDTYCTTIVHGQNCDDSVCFDYVHLRETVRRMP